MDYDADGILDFISGSYDPGDVYLFRGLGGGDYAAVSRILDCEGVPLVHHPEELARYDAVLATGKVGSIRDRVASFGSWPAMVDWDGDGDLDMLIGSFQGAVWLRTNDGTRQQPVWGADSVRIEADGEPLQVYCHANPVVADWNGDGTWDLVVGAGDGSVRWYENSGTETTPRLGAPRLLVAAKSDDKFLLQQLAHGEAPAPGVRAQICVVDYDRDGRLDLLLGDYSKIEQQRELTGDERQHLAAVREAIAAARQALQLTTPDSDAAKARQDELDRLEQRKRGFLAPPDDLRSEGLHSFVWLFRRTER